MCPRHTSGCCALVNVRNLIIQSPMKISKVTIHGERVKPQNLHPRPLDNT